MPRSQSQVPGRTLTAVGIDTPAGQFIARFSDRGLAQLNFPRRYAPSPSNDPSSFSPELREWIALTHRAVLAVLAGQPAGDLPPLDLSAGTAFQQRVWTALRQLQLGQTKGYGEIAADIGSPKATRAVGGACGANPIPLLIPCHRVLAANVKLGGFSGGLDWKLRLLAAEGVAPSG
jgi:O-6-methylguanine DNA methyltransferase